MNTGSMSEKTACDVAVIGGGAAGMMAALQAAWAGARVALLEKNEKLGKKIYITGKGRCNVTNVADIEDFFKQIPRNPRFLNAAARQFTHEDVTGLLDMLGTPTKVERGGRVFPESDKASDVTRALDRGMRDAGVVISLNTEAAHVKPAEYGFDIALTQGGVLRAGSVIVATGGVSYPSTGSTGDGYRFAKENGLNAVAEGSNMDDNGDYRPGLVAVKELGVSSPLRAAELNKQEIRELSKELGLSTWNKQSFACLSSRFVYGETINEEKLGMVEKAEQLLLDLGFYQVRVRIHDKMARIEILPSEFEKLLAEGIREKVYNYFKELGFTYVTLDLGGYRTGSMNETLH